MTEPFIDVRIKSRFKIEKGVPIPMANRQISKYPWREMAVGDSLLIPGSLQECYSVRTSAAYFAKRNPEYKFTIHRVHEPPGVRVWRIKARETPDLIPAIVSRTHERAAAAKLKKPVRVTRDLATPLR